VIEGLITVHLVMEPAKGDEMRRPPTSPKEPLFPAFAASALSGYALRAQADIPEDGVRTETLTLFAMCEWLNVLDCRSELRSGLSLSLLRNRWLLSGLVLANVLQRGEVFHTAPIEPAVMGWLLVAALPVLPVEEARKSAARRALCLRV